MKNVSNDVFFAWVEEEIAQGIINEISSYGNVDKSMLYYDTLRALVNNIQIVEIY